jgi:hypothetical protein
MLIMPRLMAQLLGFESQADVQAAKRDSDLELEAEKTKCDPSNVRLLFQQSTIVAFLDLTGASTHRAAMCEPPNQYPQQLYPRR